MSIASIPGVQFIKQSDRCYEYALDFVVSIASLGKYLNAYHDQAVVSFAPQLVNGFLEYPSIQFAGRASGRNLSLIPHELLVNVFVNDKRTGDIPYLSSNRYDEAIGRSTGAMAETIEGLSQAMFTRYYENHLASIEGRHGKRGKNQWPPVLQFGAVVRDAMSHGGTIHMFPSVPPVAYFGLTYAAADNGRKILHNDFTCADIFFLMLDMDSAF